MKKLILILSIFASGAAFGAAAQYRVRHKVEVGITQAQAATEVGRFISVGAWDQPAAQVDQCCLARTDSSDYPTGRVAWCVGSKVKNNDSLDTGDQILETLSP